jgi:two-component system, chemotaxis family, CheB/CheR fusion protein
MAMETPLPQLVVVGASAGGIEALSAFVASLPPDFKAPIVIAQHLDPRRQSHLQEILSRRSPLPVRLVEDRENLQGGTVYVVPADRHVSIADSTVETTEALPQAGDPPRSKPSIDHLLRSAAEGYGEGLIAVILSGSGSDGATGAREVKQLGGTVVVQNPKTAVFPAMPQSLAPSNVDIVADVETIGPLLQELLTSPPVPEEAAESRALHRLFDLVREQSGIDFSAYKMPTVMRRLQRRMVATGQRKVADYVRYVQRNADEYERLIGNLLIKVTDFFRDADLFEHLRVQVLPELIDDARARGQELRLWSAGCATGEEAYSLAMLVAELLGNELEQFKVRVFATDLDSNAISFARRGVYPTSAIAHLPPDLVERHFVQLDGDFEIKKRVRTLAVFGQHDLGQRAPFPRIDLCLCRNVLIYFSTELQRRALHLFAFALREGGYLALGKAETISPLAEYFAVADSQLKLYRRYGERSVTIPSARIRSAAPTVSPRLTEMGPASAPIDGRTGQPPALPDMNHLRVRRQASRLYGYSERVEGTLQQLPIGIVLADRRYAIQTINATARRLLGIHSSAIGEDLIHQAQGVPSDRLRAVIDRTIRNGVPVEREVLKMETPIGEMRFLEFSCSPARLDESSEQFALVTVIDVTEQVLQREHLTAANARLVAEVERVTRQTQRLNEINSKLLEDNQELSITNAELRSDNEELLLSQEAAQAATEEVETLNEELQATNEEQETLNEELQATVEELNATNDDLQARGHELQEVAAAQEAERNYLRAVLASVGDSVLVLDNRGMPVLSNQAYERLFGVPAEAGVPTALLELALDVERPAAPPTSQPSGPGLQVRFVHTTVDGATREFEARGTLIRGEAGRQGAVMSIREIDDTDQARETDAST